MNLACYIRHMTEARHGKPAVLATRLKNDGFERAYFLVCWQQDGKTLKQNGTRVFDYLHACRALGIHASVWGYPDPTCGLYNFTQRMLEFREAANSLCVDVELPYKKQPGPWFHLNTEMTRDALDLVITSYGRLDIHKTLPINSADSRRYSRCQPQFYRSPPETFAAGIKSWRKFGFMHFEPALPAFGPNSGAALESYALRVRDEVLKAGAHFDGIVLWSWELYALKSNKATRAAVAELRNL